MKKHAIKLLLALGLLANALVPTSVAAKASTEFEACNKDRCGDVQFCKNLGGNACTCVVNIAKGPHCHSMQAEE